MPQGRPRGSDPYPEPTSGTGVVSGGVAGGGVSEITVEAPDVSVSVNSVPPEHSPILDIAEGSGCHIFDQQRSYSTVNINESGKLLVENTMYVTDNIYNEGVIIQESGVVITSL